MTNRRLRKSTTNFHDFNSAQAVQEKEAVFDLGVANASGGFLTVDADDGVNGPMVSKDIGHRANRNDDDFYQKMREPAQGVALLHELSDRGAKDGPLGDQEIRFQARLRSDLTVNADSANLDGGGVATIAEVSHTDLLSFRWGQRDVWQDAHSSRALMQVFPDSMVLELRDSGLWRLVYRVRSYVRRHRWVYKFDIEQNGYHLFTIVTPPVISTPSERISEVRVQGRSLHLRARGEEDISEFSVFRRGVGEYVA